MSLTTGEIIDDKYRIIRLIGEGGMGAVYEGENVRIHRRVAIKVLHAGVAENQDAVQRFEREAQAAGRIGSEHIVEVLDLGNLANGDRYMVMEFLEGESLNDRIHGKGRLTPAELYPPAYQILEGLAAAHGAGIIHRDLKPDNVYLLKSRSGQADFVKLLDFGISKFSALSGESGFSMTRTGAVMGTPYYMSPEQAKGAKSMDHRADLYAVGVILYEAVTGQVPFNADTFNELLFKIVLEQPAPVRQLVPDVDPNFAAIITKGMSREPALRYQSAQEFQQALEQWAAGAGPEVAAAAAPPVRGQMPSIVGGTPLTTGTPGVWSSSSASLGDSRPAPEQKSSSGGKIAAIVLAAIVVLGVGGFAVSRMGSHPAAAATPAVDPAEDAKLKADEAAKAKADEEAKAKAEAAAKADEEAKAKADAEAKAKAAAEAKTEDTAKPVATARPVAHPVTHARPPATHATAAAPPTAAPAHTGRVIRENL